MDNTKRVTIDHEALVELINAINEVHDTHPLPNSPEMKNLLDWKRKVWDSVRCK